MKNPKIKDDMINGGSWPSFQPGPELNSREYSSDRPIELESVKNMLKVDEDGPDNQSKQSEQDDQGNGLEDVLQEDYEDGDDGEDDAECGKTRGPDKIMIEQDNDYRKTVLI
jgi:hypothetical protein